MYHRTPCIHRGLTEAPSRTSRSIRIEQGTQYISGERSVPAGFDSRHPLQYQSRAGNGSLITAPEYANPQCQWVQNLKTVCRPHPCPQA